MYSSFIRYSVFILVLSAFSACSGIGNDFEKVYYERITGIKFPEKYKVLETFDNGEWLTGTVFEVDSSILRRFIIVNHFDAFTLKDRPNLNIFNVGYFKLRIPDAKNIDNLFIVARSKDKNNWTYLADMASNRLWAVISYPDWGGR